MEGKEDPKLLDQYPKHAHTIVLEAALKLVPVSSIFDLAVTQLTGVTTILAFGGMVWYNAGFLASISESVPAFQVACIRLALQT